MVTSNNLNVPPAQNRSRRGHSMSAIQENKTVSPPRSMPLMDHTEEGLQGLFSQLKARQDKMRRDLHTTAKWYKVATKMDRIFFWSYGISVAILTFYAFVFKPMQKKVEL